MIIIIMNFFFFFVLTIPWPLIFAQGDRLEVAAGSLDEGKE